jgi:outer membrane protein assembly factor BamB
MAPACLSSTVVDGDSLYIAASATTIKGTPYPGSIDELNAATGKIVWATGLPAEVLGTPSLDGAGVLAVGTHGASPQLNADYLLNPVTGAILATVSNGNSAQFAQPVFADSYLFVATSTTGLYAYQAPTAGGGGSRTP